ncbi:MAG: hypothetical protein IPI17_01950 [Nitrosomonas sp.]|nr:hypothetical protein [Nitrosomonas sp.]
MGSSSAPPPKVPAVDQFIEQGKRDVSASINDTIAGDPFKSPRIQLGNLAGGEINFLNLQGQAQSGFDKFGQALENAPIVQDRLTAAQQQEAIDARARALGFESEADRIKKINTIISGFSRRTKSGRIIGSSPLALQGK